jgi:hypothetical protein
MDNVVPLKSKSAPDEPADISPEDKAALTWLAAQPGGAVKMSAAEFGRNVGWSRQKAGRRLDSMAKSGLVVRRAGVITLNKERTIVRTIIREIVTAPDKPDTTADKIPDTTRTRRRTSITAIPGHKPGRGHAKRTRTEPLVSLQPQAQTPGQSADEIPPAEADKKADTHPLIPPLTPHQDTVPEYSSMGLFSRPKKQPEPPAETPSGTGQDASPDRSGEGAQPPSYGGFGSPVAVTYGQVPSLHAEKPNWKFVPRRPPAEPPAWRPWKRAGRATETPPTVTVMPPRHRDPRAWGLTLVSYGFFALGVAITYWSVRGSNDGDWLDRGIPIGIGVLVEAGLFFLPARFFAVANPLKKFGVAFAYFFLLTAAMAYALNNASRTSADLGTFRGERQTVGVQAANGALERTRAQRATA